MKKRICISMIGLLMILIIAVSGCGAAKSDMAADNGQMVEESTTAGTGMSMESEYGNPEAAPEEEMLSEDAIQSDGTEQAEVKNQSKIIRTVNLQIETLHFDELVTILTQKAEQYEGYVENSEVSNNGYYGKGTRYGYFRVRIPAAMADEYIQSMGDKGVIVSQSENLEDVTLQYVDTQSHIEMLKVERERLMELLEKAETLEEVLLIEERLTNVRYELESYESQLKVLDNKINYTTIMIDVSEVEQITPPKEASLGSKIADTFMESLRGIRDGVEWLIVFIIGKIPYIAVIAVVITTAVLLVKRKKK